MFSEIHEISAAERLRRMEEDEERRRYHRMVEEMANTRIQPERNTEQSAVASKAEVSINPDQLIGGWA